MKTNKMSESETSFRNLYAEVREHKTLQELNDTVATKMMVFSNWEDYDKGELVITVGIHEMPIFEASHHFIETWRELALMDPTMDNYPYSIVRAFILFVAEDRLNEPEYNDFGFHFSNKVDFTEYLKEMKKEYDKND